MKIIKGKDGTNYLLPFILVTSLFFLWGFAHSILDVLNKHFQEVLVISKARSGLVQAVVYGGYFLMALPAGAFIRKFNYRWGVVVGLILYAVGAFMFVPASRVMTFEFFLASLFVIGCGLTFLETAANPYITELGDPKYSASRINLAQSFNGLGWIVGPLVGGLIVFQGGSVALPYTIIGVIVLLAALVFVKIPLPEIKQTLEEISLTQKKPLIKHVSFVFGAIALFFYVAAQTGINSFFINYVTEASPSIDNTKASILLSFGGMGLFMLGRVLGSLIMNKMAPSRLLSYFSVGAIITMLFVILGSGWWAIIALFFCYLFESIMFPTIFALSLEGLNGGQIKQGSSILIMCIVGGAIAPVLMGLIGEEKMSLGFIVPLICFIVVAFYSFYKVKKSV